MQNIQLLSFVLRQLHSSWVQRTTTATADAAAAATATAINILQPFNGLFSRTTWVTRYQEGEASQNLNETRDYGY